MLRVLWGMSEVLQVFHGYFGLLWGISGMSGVLWRMFACWEHFWVCRVIVAGTLGYVGGTLGYLGVCWGYTGYVRGTSGYVKSTLGYVVGTSGYVGGTQGYIGGTSGMWVVFWCMLGHTWECYHYALSRS